MAWVIKELRLEALAHTLVERAQDAAETIRGEAERDARRARRTARREAVDADEHLAVLERLGAELHEAVREQRQALRRVSPPLAAGASPPAAVTPLAEAPAAVTPVAVTPVAEPPVAEAPAPLFVARGPVSAAPATDTVAPAPDAVAPAREPAATSAKLAPPEEDPDAPRVSGRAAERRRRGGRASLRTRAVAELFQPTEPAPARS